MSTKRGHDGRKDSIKGDVASLAGPAGLESLGPSKYTFKKKKKHNKWSPFDLSVTDSVSEAGSNSEVGVDTGSSRAVSPNPQSFGSASVPPSPRPSASTLDIASISSIGSADKADGRFVGEAEFKFSHIEQSLQTPTQQSFGVAAAPAGIDKGECRFVEEAGPNSNEVEADYQTETTCCASFSS